MISTLNPKLTLLGHGPFARPAFEALVKQFEIVTQDKADCLIVANYGKILSPIELHQPLFGAINIHGSVLPHYRGASPIQTAIKNDESETGVTIIVMDEKVDHGPMLGSATAVISPDDTTESMRIKLGLLAVPLLLKTLPLYFSGNIPPIAQNEKDATFTNKISAKDTLLDLNWPGIRLYNYFRAYGQEPGVFIQLDGQDQLKILEALLVDNQFTPTIVQRSGRKPVSYTDFLRGYRGSLPFLIA